jgi:ABC-2 type transport system ATP-binding protein
MAAVIETKKLTKYYGKSRGIIDVDISVEEGEIYGFIGPNGAGKSTTIRILLALIYATGGTATIFGKDVVKDGPEIRQEIGYLPSEVFYYDNMRVRELLDYSASFYKKDCSKRIKELSEIMDLDLDKKIDDLSYGNKKKVGIVQGLLHEPKLIILDEPTGGLDPLMQQKFFDLIHEENKKGATVFLSSHILSEVQRLCDRVAIIKEGKIIQIERMSDLGKSNYSQFRIVANKPIAKDYFAMEGVSELKTNETHVSFLFKGDLNMMVKMISALDLQSLMVEEPDLEDIFLHYYQ